MLLSMKPRCLTLSNRIPWCTVSNTFLRSRKSTLLAGPSSIFEKIWWQKPITHEPVGKTFLNPDCSVDSKLNHVRHHDTWLWTKHSCILPKHGITEIGRKMFGLILSLDLCKEVIHAVCRSDGKVLDNILILHTWSNTGYILGPATFSKCVVIPSAPQLVDNFTFFVYTAICSISTLLRSKICGTVWKVNCKWLPGLISSQCPPTSSVFEWIC